MKIINLFLIMQILLYVLARKNKVKRTKVKLDKKIIEKVEAYKDSYKEILKETDDSIKEKKIRVLVEDIETLLDFNQDSTKQFLNEVINFFSTKITDEANGYHRLIRIINHANRLLVEQSTSIDDEALFDAANTLSEEENFSATKEEDFYQPPFKGACRLYSTLFALTKNKTLLNDLNSLVKKNSTAYIIKLNEKYYSVPIENVEIIKSKNSKSKLEANPLKLAVDELSPSSNPLVIAFGIALQKRSRDSHYGQIDQNVAYDLADFSLKDLIFGKSVIYVEVDKNNMENIFKPEGKISIGDKDYSGDFIVSLETTTIKKFGHAASAFFDGSKWMLFDNFLDPHLVELNTSNLKSKYEKIYNFSLIGNPQIKKRKKLKKVIK